jgi:3-hydroxybutyryl-CoA dehydrogenase
MIKIGVIGGGTMGGGIAQVAATFGCRVVIYDTNVSIFEKNKKGLAILLAKGKISENIISNISYSNALTDLKDCNLVIEAIVENLEVKKKVFSELESIVEKDCILATNTSSLSVTAIAGGCIDPQRVIGIHFFNPAPLMPLVEVIPAIQTSEQTTIKTQNIVKSWGKTVVIGQDTPGFIVNRIARPFYGEALRLLEEGVANKEMIDYAMTQYGGFKMGPFALMDLIGNDVNYAVTESVWRSMYFDQRYQPSISQLRLVEAGYYGRKSGQGFYQYPAKTTTEDAHTATYDDLGCQFIFSRILTLLINEAADALWKGIATEEDIETAMTKGVNYPKGLLAWGKEIGYSEIARRMDSLYTRYKEDRYRCCPWLRIN